MSREEAGGNSGLLHKEMRMSREDDFFGDLNDSPDDLDTGQEDTYEPMRGDSTAEPAPVSEPARPTAPRAKPKAKKKAKTKPKLIAKKKKVSKTTRKPAAKKIAKKKIAKKKTTAAKKKKSARPKK